MVKTYFSDNDDEKKPEDDIDEQNIPEGDLDEIGGNIPPDTEIPNIDIPEEEDEDLTDNMGGPGGRVKVPKPNKAF